MDFADVDDRKSWSIRPQQFTLSQQFDDEEGQFVEPLIPPGKRGGGERRLVMHEVVNGLMYILSTGCQGAALPKELLPKSTEHDYFDLGGWDRKLKRIHEALYLAFHQ